MQGCTSLLVVDSAGRVGWSLPDPLNIDRAGQTGGGAKAQTSLISELLGP